MVISSFGLGAASCFLLKQGSPGAATRMSVAEHKNIAIRLALVELQP
jgi:hypothetical protein